MLSDPTGLCPGGGYVYGKCVTDEDTTDGYGGSLGAGGVAERNRWQMGKRSMVRLFTSAPGPDDDGYYYPEGYSDIYFMDGSSTFHGSVRLDPLSENRLISRAGGNFGSESDVANINQGSYTAVLIGYNEQIVKPDSDDSNWVVGLVGEGTAVGLQFVPVLGPALDASAPILFKDSGNHSTLQGIFLVTTFDFDGSIIGQEVMQLDIIVTVSEADQKNQQNEGTTPDWNPTIPALGLVFSGNGNTECIAGPCDEGIHV